MLLEDLRTFAERHKYLAIAGAVFPFVLAVFVAVAYYGSPAPPSWPMAYYQDEETGEVTIRPANEIPPLLGRSGRPTVVRVVYLTASTVDKKFVGYFEKFTDEARARQTPTAAGNGAISLVPFTMAGILIRRPEAGSPWVGADSPEGLKMIEAIYRPKPDAPVLRSCLPE